GQTALAAHDTDLARASFQSALRVNHNHDGALLGMLNLMIDLRDAEAATAFAEQLKAHDLTSEEFDLAYARFLIWRQPSKASRTIIAAAARRHPDSVQLQILLAQSYLQAGLYINAGSAFNEARQHGAPEALMRASVAFAYGLGGMSRAAETTLKYI